MTQTQKQWWEQERAKGEARYVLRVGLLRMGLPFAAIMTVVPLLNNVFTIEPIEPLWKLGVKFAFFVVGFGGMMGAMLWRDRERDYQKPTEDEDSA